VMYPGLASWAKFSRPCGTEFGGRFVSIHPHRNVTVTFADIEAF
jgi:hypothetical protein